MAVINVDLDFDPSGFEMDKFTDYDKVRIEYPEEYEYICRELEINSLFYGWMAVQMFKDAINQLLENEKETL